jgi:hypothetical protein
MGGRRQGQEQEQKAGVLIVNCEFPDSLTDLTFEI